MLKINDAVIERLGDWAIGRLGDGLLGERANLVGRGRLGAGGRFGDGDACLLPLLTPNFSVVFYLKQAPRHSPKNPY